MATKHSGAGIAHIRDRAPITPSSIPQAIDGSLKRLKTDVIDLYQFHWPNRGSYMFRQNWSYDPSKQNKAETVQNIQDCLGALALEVERGRIRAFGLSNESAWGTAQWVRAAEEGHGPRVASIQNEYSLMCRMYDTDLAELSANEDVGLLSFSPLATGLLTGKYAADAVPEGSRMSVSPELGGRNTARAHEAAAAYVAVAQKHGTGSGSYGSGLVCWPAVHGLRHFWCDQSGPAGAYLGRQGYNPAERGFSRFEQNPPCPSDAVLKAQC